MKTPRRELGNAAPSCVARVEAQAEAVWARTGLALANQALLLMVSGGPDSTALCAVVAHWQETVPFRVGVLTVDHGLRPESAAEVALVRQLAERYGWTFHTVREEVAQEAAARGLSVETYGRLLRQEAAKACCAEGGYTYVLTGHHQGDQVETVLAHWIRGTGPEGLRGMAYHEGVYVRPLLQCTKADLVAYCDAQGLPYAVDATNADCTYQRNAIRHTVVPPMEALNPQLGAACQRLADIMTVEDDFMAQATEALYRAAYASGDAAEGALYFHKAVVAEAHPAIRYRFWRQVAEQFTPYGHTPTYVQVQAMDRLLYGEGNKQFSLKWMKICVQYDKIYCAWSIGPGENPPSVVPCSYEPRWTAGHTYTQTTAPGTFLIPANYAARGLQVRTRRPGDRIVLTQVTRQAWGHKPLKKYMSEQRISPSERDHRLWLVAGEEVLCEAKPTQAYTLYDPEADSYVLGYFEEEWK